MEKIYSRELIDYANIKSGLLRKNFISSRQDFLNFYKKQNGIGILIPANKNFFDFSKESIFKINKKELLSNVYKHNNLNYKPFKFSYKTEHFLSNFNLKKKYLSDVNKIINNNKTIIKKIHKLKKKYKLVGAFQTRNIPHDGHLAIMDFMLKKCNHVVVNPVFGPKINSDIDLTYYQKKIEMFLKKFFSGKVSLSPVFANMFYAGPTEAIHHSILRKNLGFTHFSVGRDHAGSEKIYPEQDAQILAKQHSGEIGIEIITHKGAVYCNKCSKAIVRDDCKHHINSFIEISGSDFRKNLKIKKYYMYANKTLQSKILMK